MSDKHQPINVVITAGAGCDHEIVDCGDGMGRCTKCGDNTFPMYDPFDFSDQLGNLAQQRKERTDQIISLLYRFARHVANSSNKDPIAWGVEALELLGELKEFSPERYAQEMSEDVRIVTSTKGPEE